MAFRHVVKDRNGKVYKRTSAGRQYKYAIIAHWPERAGKIKPDMVWPAHSEAQYSSDLRNAIYARDRIIRCGGEAEIIDVEPVQVKR